MDVFFLLSMALLQEGEQLQSELDNEKYEASCLEIELEEREEDALTLSAKLETSENELKAIKPNWERVKEAVDGHPLTKPHEIAEMVEAAFAQPKRAFG